MPQVIYATMRQKRQSYAWFQQNNPVLDDGQIGIITYGQHRYCFKIGDGVTPWNNLAWVTDYTILFNKPKINGITLEGDKSLQQIGAVSIDDLNSVAAIATGAAKALVFDDHAQLNAWMDGQIQPFEPPVLPSQLRSGWEALFRTENEADLWWDGDASPPQWREAEVTIDLSGYRQADAQDVIDDNLRELIEETDEDLRNRIDLKADIDSPTLTGIPRTPRPNGTIAEQIEQVGRVNALFLEFHAQMEAVFPALIGTLEEGGYIGTIGGQYIWCLTLQ